MKWIRRMREFFTWRSRKDEQVRNAIAAADRLRADEAVQFKVAKDRLAQAANQLAGVMGNSRQ